MRVIAATAAVVLLAVALGASPAAAVKHIPQTRSLTVSITAAEERCFYAYSAHAEDRVMFHFQVRQGQTDFDVHVKRPNGDTVYYSAASEHGNEDKVYFITKEAGEYAFCLDNTGHSRSEKIVALMIAIKSRTQVTKKTDPLIKMLQKARASLDQLINDQVYLRTREWEHRDTMESNNFRVVIRSLIELGVLLAMSVGQVWYLRRLFDKKTSGQRAAA